MYTTSAHHCPPLLSFSNLTVHPISAFTVNCTSHSIRCAALTPCFPPPFSNSARLFTVLSFSTLFSSLAHFLFNSLPRCCRRHLAPFLALLASPLVRRPLVAPLLVARTSLLGSVAAAALTPHISSLHLTSHHLTSLDDPLRSRSTLCYLRVEFISTLGLTNRPPLLPLPLPLCTHCSPTQRATLHTALLPATPSHSSPHTARAVCLLHVALFRRLVALEC